MAYADGKEIEFYRKSTGKWEKDENPSFYMDNHFYRIKPEPIYRPFKDKEECVAEMMKHQPFGLVRYGINYLSIMSMDPTGVEVLYEGGVERINYNDCLKILTFIDDTPFGILED